MKNLSLLLALSLICQSVMGLNVQEWKELIGRYESNIRQNNSLFSNLFLIQAYKDLIQIQTELSKKEITSTQLNAVYNHLSPVLMVAKYKETKSYSQLTEEEKLNWKIKINEFVECEKALIEGLLYHKPTDILTSIKNYVANNPKKVGGTIATAAALALAYRNRDTLKQTASNQFENACNSRLGLATRWTFYQGLNKLSDLSSSVTNYLASKIEARKLAQEAAKLQLGEAQAIEYLKTKAIENYNDYLASLPIQAELASRSETIDIIRSLINKSAQEIAETSDAQKISAYITENILPEIGSIAQQLQEADMLNKLR